MCATRFHKMSIYGHFEPDHKKIINIFENVDVRDCHVQIRIFDM